MKFTSKALNHGGFPSKRETLGTVAGYGRHDTVRVKEDKLKTVYSWAPCYWEKILIAETGGEK